MIQLNPGDHIVLTEPSDDDPNVEVSVPAQVKQIRWQHTENGEAAIAVLLTFGEMITTRVLTLDVEQGETEAGGATYRACFAREKIVMASPEIIAEIQERLRVQRDNMRINIQASVQAPVNRSRSTGGGASSVASRERQRERAKERRQEEKAMREKVIAAVMEKQGCTEEDAIKYLLAQAGG